MKDPGEAATSRGVTNPDVSEADVTKSTQWPCRGCGATLSGRGGRRYCGPDCRPRCSIESCEKPEHSKGWCSAHATRAARYGDPLAPKLRGRNEGPCSVEGCDRPMRKTGLCSNHYAMQYAEGEIRDWKFKWGEGGYVPAHKTVARIRGKAKDHTCADCGEPADEWSYNGGDPNELTDDQGRRFTRNPDAYSPRCFKCHRIFDDNPIAMRAHM